MKVRDLMNKRMQQKWDRDSVNLWLFDDYEPANKHDVVIEHKKAGRIDFRPFYGLNVFVCAQSYDETLVAMVDRLKQSANFILVAIIDFGEELGWKWSRDFGVETL